MEKVPQIVSERLQAMNMAVNHPDANMLTAFSERTLSGAERAIVVEHLGNCSECREIVALALPIAEPDQQVLRAPKPSWLTWPVLRWGLVAAGIIVVGSFGLLQYQNRQQNSAAIASKVPATVVKEAETLAQEAKNVSPAVPAPAADKDKQALSSKRSDQAPSSGDTAAKSEMVAAQPSSPSIVRDLPVAKTLQHGPHVQLQQNANNLQNQTLPPPATPPAPARVLNGQVHGNVPLSNESAKQTRSVAPDGEVQTANLDSAAAPLQSQADLRQFPSRVERSKPASAAAKTAATIGGPAVSGPNQPRLLTMTPASPVTWSISSSGALQRSFDQGKSWQNVDISAVIGNAPVAAFHAYAQQEVVASTKSDSLKKDVSAPTFRAVVANGPDVWAGASGGLLYHSTDAGSHWTRVVPSTSSARLSGDILSLEFPDPLHGRVVTAVPEVWTTADGGQTWQKQ